MLLKVSSTFTVGDSVFAHLYRELCMDMDLEQKKIGTFLTLLHIWAWDKIPRLTPLTHLVSVVGSSACNAYLHLKFIIYYLLFELIFICGCCS